MLVAYKLGHAAAWRDEARSAFQALGAAPPLADVDLTAGQTGSEAS